eukprot:TRINITY_DN40663_c0_g1_i1.p1 TRINITY_DN40663_c0_g1~~TRINITY_DN40663_c0_g1_i1.p1  ORF type:complete len:1271 (+),score=305.82 TRINITY_DN40663_c0_g1_i1:447-3815(+)
MEQVPVTYSPGFLKVFDEILVNALDQQFAKPRKRSRSTTTEISVEVNADTGYISVTNDGVGIPVEFNDEYDAWVPSFIYGEMLTGSNFDDTAGPRIVGGRNGVGAKATNIFSKVFRVEVTDPATRRHFSQTWRDNMQTVESAEITEGVDAATGQVSVEFLPDFARFGMEGLDASSLQLLKTRVLDAAACSQPGIRVRLNQEELPVQSFDDYSRLLLGETNYTMTTISAKGLLRLEVAVGVTKSTKGFQALGFVNGIRCNAGTHVEAVVRQIIADTTGRIRKLKRFQDMKIPAQFVRDHLVVMVKALIDSPSFESQTKERLATPEKDFGFKTQLPKTFLKEISRLGLVKLVTDYASFRDDAKSANRLASAADHQPRLPKLDDAGYAGMEGHDCTLILTEGDSAKAMALGALESVPGSRDHYGIFPLKGKLLNVRKATMNALSNSDGIRELMQALGLKLRKKYTSVAAPHLRYQKIMIFTDQDPDGDHITGLIINFISKLWPTILDVEPRFVMKFVTPLVKVTNYPGMQFYSMQEWEQWASEQKSRKPIPKYYKGLGTSSDAEAAEYFQDLKRHTLEFEWAGSSDEDALKLAFGSGDQAADARKSWLLDVYDPEVYFDYSRDTAPHHDFFDQSFIHFSMYDNQRSIPHLMDGLKNTQRKAICFALGRLKSDTKVTVFANAVMSAMKYHHGEVSMTEAIIHLAQTHVGTNNINFLRPRGQFGSRLHSRSEHAQARYIGVELEPIAKKLFRPEDEPILDYQLEEMHEVEPRFLLPVVPTVLLNGGSGIGTGWSSDVANYNPLEVIAATRQVLDGDTSPQTLTPWYRGFHGEIFEDGGKFMSAGVWHVGMSAKGKRNPDVIQITELPIGTWTDDYRLWLHKSAALQGMIKRIDTSQNGKATVNIKLLCDGKKLQQFLKQKNDFKLGKALGLIKRVPSMMWLWNQTGKLELFEDTDAVIRSFVAVRLPMYERRLQHMRETAVRELERSRSRVEFIRCVVNRTLKLSPPPPLEKLQKQLRRRGFQQLQEYDARGRPSGEASFDHLLNMQFTSLTEEKARRLAQDVENQDVHLQKLKNKSAIDVWREDLEELEAEYRRFQESDQTLPPTEATLQKVTLTSNVRDFLARSK